MTESPPDADGHVPQAPTEDIPSAFEGDLPFQSAIKRVVFTPAIYPH